MKKYIIGYVLLLILIPFSMWFWKESQIKPKNIVQEEPMLEIIHENNIEYWCNKTLCKRANPTG